MTRVNFINALCAAFTRADPESIKFQLSRQCYFTLLGFAGVEAAEKNVDEIDTWAQFHQHITPVAPKCVRIQSSCQCLFTLLESTGEKAAFRTLMKLTPGVNFTNLMCCQKEFCEISFTNNTAPNFTRKHNQK